MKTKWLISFCLLSTLLLGAVSLSLNSNKENVFASKSSTDRATSMSTVAVAENEELDKDNIIYDDFETGLDSSMWAVSEKKWGNDYNSGVRHENVFYNSYDNTILFRALGEYYSGNEFYNNNSDAYTTDGTYTGGCLISKDEYGPGRYEVRMKLAPIPGVCSAFWVYSGDYEKYTEIDIEFPSRQWDDANEFNRYRFNQMICSTYVAEKTYSSVHANIMSGGNPIYLNDNEFHDYAFEWYHSDNNSMVRWFVDGKLVEVLYTNVPEYTARLWVGCWIPNNQYFVGEAKFDTAYMDVDWVKYTPFKNQNVQITNHPLQNVYTGVIGTKSVNIRNLLPNDGFKNDSLIGYTSSGNGTFDLNSSYSSGNSYGVKVIGENINARTDLYVEGLKSLEFSADYKGYGSISINFYDEANQLLNSIPLFSEFSPTVFTNARKKVNIPSSSKRAVVVLSTESNSIGLMVDNLFLGFSITKTNNGDSYGISSKQVTSEPAWGEQSVSFDGTPNNWRIVNGNSKYAYKGDLNTILLTKTAALSYPDGNNAVYIAIHNTMLANNLFNIVDGTASDRWSNTAIIQEFDMTYFNDIEFDFYSLSGYNSWRKMAILYSIDSGVSWGVLATYRANIDPSEHSSFRYIFKASKEDLAVDYDTIRFAFVSNTNPNVDEDGCRLTSIIINKLNNFKSTLDYDDVCHVNSDDIEFINYQYDSLSSSEKASLSNEEMLSDSKTYQEGYDYLLNYWSTLNNSSPLSILDNERSQNFLIILIISVSVLTFTSIIVIKKTISKHNKK